MENLSNSINPSQVNVLIACEESQAECIAFLKKGFNAFSCDLKLCKRGGLPSRHIVGDVSPLLQGQISFTTQDGIEHSVSKWHLIVAHPPCTYLCKVGSPWLYVNPDYYTQYRGVTYHVNSDRYQKLINARSFFMQCLHAHCDYLAVENPIPMALADLPAPSTYACPSWYGVKYSKKTLYWLKNLPPLMPTITFPHPKCFTTSSRGIYRSRTFPQMADAIAEQWSQYILNDINRSRSWG